MMDLVISPLIFLGSALLVGGIWFSLDYWKRIRDIPEAVGVQVPIPAWVGLIQIVAGVILAWTTDWHLSAIALGIFGLGTTLPAALVALRSYQLRPTLEEEDDYVDFDEADTRDD